MTSVIGTMKRSNRVVATPSPSTADRTEIDGVSTPSPYSSAAPNSPASSSRKRGRGPARSASPALMSESRARMPPSPSLSARMTKARYLIEMTTVSAQKMSERTPSTLSGVISIGCSPRKHSRNAYSGDVPMSP